MTVNRVQVPIDGALKVTVDRYVEKQGGSRAQAIKFLAELGARLWDREDDDTPVEVSDREVLEEVLLLVRRNLMVSNVTHSQTFDSEEMIKNDVVAKALRDKFVDKAQVQQADFLAKE
jgi:hypothetical protein